MGNLLVPFKKFLSNKNTVTILGVLVGLVVLYFGYTWRISSAVQSVQVPFANRRLVGGQYISEDDIGWTELPQKTVNGMPNLVLTYPEIKGKIVSFDSVIQENGFFYFFQNSGNIMEGQAMPNFVYSKLKVGETIYSLSVDFERTYANSIMPNDFIDLYMHLEDTAATGGDKIYGKFVTSIQVLAVRDGSGKDVFADSANLGTPSQLLFAVDEAMYLLLKKAEYSFGSDAIIPVLHNESYQESGAGMNNVTSEKLKEIVENGWADNSTLG